MSDDNAAAPATEDALNEGLLFAGQKEREAFEGKLGRPPVENASWHFDPTAMTPQAFSRETVRIGTAPICEMLERLAEDAECQVELWRAMVYGTRRTGLVIDQYSDRKASAADRLTRDMALQGCADASPSDIQPCVKTVQ
jgi:hypothetical protein